jgi:VanZ family protein
MGIIFYFSHLPGNPTYYEPTLKILIERKGAHVVEYAVLLLLSSQFFSLLFPKESLRKIVSVSLVWSFSYAVADELHQFFTPYRGASIKDVGIDAIGILAALIIIAIIFFSQKKKKDPN